MTAKVPKMIPPPNDFANGGKKLAINAAKTQWVKLPQAMPDARTEFGKISEMKTQITEPCPMAWAAIKAKI